MTQWQLDAAHDGADQCSRSGNWTVFGKRLAVADWRQLGSLLSQQTSQHTLPLDADRQVALVEALRQLDAWLSVGPIVSAEGNVHRVEVFGVLLYVREDGDKPAIRGEHRNLLGQVVPLNETFALLPSLIGVWWLGLVLDAWGVSWRSGPPASPGPSGEQERLLLAILRRMLDADVRFRRLRAQLGRLVLGDELLSLATRSSLHALDSQHVQLVMTHCAVFEEVDRVHPKLLPLLALWLCDFSAMCVQMKKDGASAREFFSAFHECTCVRMPAKAWPWLVRNGLGFLRGHRFLSVNFMGVRELIREFIEIGIGSPAPRRLMGAWFALNGRKVKEGWVPIPYSVRRVLVREAHVRKTRPGFDAWCKEALQVMFAVTDPNASFGPVPKGAGWKWLKASVERYLWEESCRHIQDFASWPSPIGSLEVLGMKVLPLTCASDMYEESVYMHSCLADHIERCQQGKELVVSVRDAHDKPVANIAYVRFRPSGRNEMWCFREAKGRFNREVSPGIWRVAAIVEQVLRANNFTRARQLAGKEKK